MRFSVKELREVLEAVEARHQLAEDTDDEFGCDFPSCKSALLKLRAISLPIEVEGEDGHQD